MDSLYTGLLHTHSILRWALLIFIIGALVLSILGMAQKKPFGKTNANLTKLSLIFSHVQLLIGLVLYFVSPIVKKALQDMGAAMKNPDLRYWAVEHISVMIIGIALITIGHIKAKKAAADAAKHKNVVIFFAIGLVLILSRIPWERAF